jgi:hypothetical protein
LVRATAAGASAGALVIVLAAPRAVRAEPVAWPQRITAPEGTITVYQPQPDTEDEHEQRFTGNPTTLPSRLDRTSVGGSRQARSLGSVYNQPQVSGRNVERATAMRNLKMAHPTRGQLNNVYTDPHGNVARREGQSWQTCQGGSWQRAPSDGAAATARPQNRPRAQPETRPAPQSRPSYDFGDLNRQHSMRQQGRMREMRRPAGGRGFRR